MPESKEARDKTGIWEVRLTMQNKIARQTKCSHINSLCLKRLQDYHGRETLTVRCENIINGHHCRRTLKSLQWRKQRRKCHLGLCI